MISVLLILLLVAALVTLVPNDRFATTTRHMVCLAIALLALFWLMAIYFGVVVITAHHFP